MANEVTVPLLPCSSIDDMAAFYEVLGFHATYRQQKPNPYIALRREDLHLHFFAMNGFKPEDSYGSCLVVTPDLEGLHRAFTEGMRAAYGKVLVSGMPRMTRPRARKNAGGVGGFSVIDPGGNWIRFVQDGGTQAPEADGPLGKALADAVVQADSRGDTRQAVRILDTALRRSSDTDDPVALVEVLVYRAELALTLDDRETAAAMLARFSTVALTPEQEAEAASASANADELFRNL